MANPPFNVDEVDAETVSKDKRPPFGLPGVNKAKKVSNANYLWLQYFYSYLNENGRAGVVMSSQASSAGRDEALVRRKLVETGAVDVMIDIRGNFFYTRTVPCQLWFYDRAKERDPERADNVLMLDARGVFRKVSRSLVDFSPEQQKNLASIVWLYRGQRERFLRMVESYLREAITLGQRATEPLEAFCSATEKLTTLMRPFATKGDHAEASAGDWQELSVTQATVQADSSAFLAEVKAQAASWAAETGGTSGRSNAEIHKARKALHLLADRCRDLTRQVDLLVKLAGRVADTAVKHGSARDSALWKGAEVARARKALETGRAEAVEALRLPRYFVRQADWLQERFPDAVLADVAGLVKSVSRAEIAAHDWSLTPGRYVGVAPEEVDENFDFEETMRTIHIDLKGLNDEAVVLAAKIEKNFVEMGA